jgi:hypothetical protein
MRELGGRDRQGGLVSEPKTPAPRKVPATRSQADAKATNVQTLPLATVLADESSHQADGFWLIEWTASKKEKKPVVKSLAGDGTPALAVDAASKVGRKVTFANLSESSLYSLVHMRSGQVPSVIFEKRSIGELGKWFDPPTLGNPKNGHLAYIPKKTKPPEPTADEKDDDLLPNASWYVAMDVPEPEPDADDGDGA